MARSESGRRVKPSGGFELGMWFFMRISGLILVFLALGHLFITHILNNVETINYYFVATRWGDPKTGVLWRLWDLTLINLAVLHGFNGLRQVLDEYVIRPNRRVMAKAASRKVPAIPIRRTLGAWRNCWSANKPNPPAPIAPMPKAFIGV